MKQATDNELLQPTQRALMVALDRGGRGQEWRADESLDELERLADTAGALVVGREIQRRATPDVATFIGEGKVQEIEHRRRAEDFDLVIFDDELSPVQQRNLAEVIQCAVIDRTALILDIFAQRARTREAKLQVELAQQQYRLPRLIGLGKALSRLGGGIGTRGPGETKLEADRRHVRERIGQLRADLKEIQAHRERLREGRKERSVPVVALVGYTNAGKSTLHRTLSGSDVLAENRLFATLDAVGRRVEPAEGEPYVVMDTVGFIQKLPHQLVAAFRSTLEEAKDADLLLHVVDASHPKLDAQMLTVAEVLQELKADRKPQLVVFNQVDKVESPGLVAALLRQHPGSVAVSALHGEGIGELQAAIQGALRGRRELISVTVPYRQAGLVAFVHANGRVLQEEHREDGTYLEAELERGLAGKVLAELGLGPAKEEWEA